MDLETAARIAGLLALVGLNGFFVASEFSLVAMRRTRLDELAAAGVQGASSAKRLIGNLDQSIAATQLGITISGLALGAIGDVALAPLLEPAAALIPGADATIGSRFLALAASFAIITALTIVLGELAPKSLALQRTERVVLVVSAPVEVFSWVFSPIVRMLNAAGALVIRLAGLDPAISPVSAHSAAELELLVESSREAGVLNEQEARLVSRAFDFADRSARQIMTPRTIIIAAPADSSYADLLDLAARSGVTRVPLYEGTVDQIVGVVHIKDLLRIEATNEGERPAPRTFMRVPLSVPDTVRVESLLVEMQEKRQHLCVVVDEFGQTAGLVTLEDVLEEIVGELRDEFDRGERAEPIVRTSDGAVVDGLVDIDRFNDEFELDVSSEEYDTVGGYVLGRLGRLAAVGDRFEVGPYAIEVLDLAGRRVRSVRLSHAAGTARNS